MSDFFYNKTKGSDMDFFKKKTLTGLARTCG